MSLKIILVAIALPFFIVGCSYESTSDLIDLKPISENITFTRDVKTIIDANCIECHANLPIYAPMSLTIYQNVKDAMLASGEKNLLYRITLPQTNDKHMPYLRASLPPNLIQVIRKWNEQGLQE